MKINFSSVTIKRPVATIMITLMVVVLGFSAAVDIPKDLMPNIELPVAMVMTTYSNASPEEVETMVSAPVEQALASVEGLDEMISYSMEGMSVVLISFQMDTDMDFASLNMREKIALISDYLPGDASEPMVLKLDMNTMPVMQIYASADMPLEELNILIEDNVLSYFERSKGVASVSVYGGLEREIAMEFSQESITNYGLTLATVSQILAAENINLPSGDVSKGATKVIVRTIGEFSSVEEIADLPLMVADRSIVRLGDVASISEGLKEQESITRIDGKTAIGIMISKQSDANTVDVSKALLKELDKVEAKYPQLSFVVGMDQADYINNSISSVAQAALTGGILAILVVFIFLRNIRSTLVIGFSIPTSILATFAIMNFRHITLNLVTLCALTLAVGMIVDNSIVVLENIYRTRSMVPTAEEAASKGSSEVFMAILASTLTTVLVFLPIALSEGMASMMFSEFCFTIIIALMASLVVALTVVPMLCSKLLQGNISTTYVRFGEKRYKYKYVTKFAAYLDKFMNGYEQLARKALQNRKKILVYSVVGFLVSAILLVFVGWELLPAADEGMVSITVDMPYGTSLAEKDAIMTEVEKYVLSVPEVEHASLSTESTSAMSMTQSAGITIMLSDKNDRRRSSEDVAEDIQQHVSYITGADISVNANSSIMSMFGSADTSVMLMGKDYEKLSIIGEDIVGKISQLPAIKDAATDVTEGNPEIRVIINRNTASYYGITAYQLATGLSSALNGKTATNVTIDGNDIEVNLSLTDYYSQSVENMKQIVITGSYGMSVPVGQIATFDVDNAPSVINRYNQQNYIVINANMVGTDLQEANNQVQAVLDEYQFPDGYYYEMSGIASEMTEAFGSLLKALFVSIALVFLLLAAQFESAIMAFIVMMAIPFAMSGAFLAMFLTGTALSLTSFLGLIMLVGIVVNNSILLVEFINQNRESMGVNEALVQAGKLRLRPILMTTLTTCVGMIPLSLGVGEGGEMLAPIGISVIGGLTASTAITLIIIPILYSLIDDRKNARMEKLRLRDVHIKELEDRWAEEDARS